MVNYLSLFRKRSVTGYENLGEKKNADLSHNGLKSNKPKFFLWAGLFFLCCLALYFHLLQWNNPYSHSATLLDNLSITLGLKNYVYSIVIDAGSTGTRILFYGFVSSPIDKTLKLDKEYFREVKPGISSFVNNPRESVKNLELLLDEVKDKIPKEEWSKTSLLMRATAGLRLLPGHQADALLKEAKKFFKKTEFKIDEDSVSILEGRDEGIFSWFTVNFLLDRLEGNVSNTVVALDLGGGSTQVSFAPLKGETLTSTQAQYLYNIVAYHRNLEVFSRSYLGLGLNEGRKRILQHNSKHSTTLKSVCINPLVNTKWSYGGVDYTVQGSENLNSSRARGNGKTVEPFVNFVECEKVVKAVTAEFERAPSLANKEIYAFSYYYDRAVDSGLLDLRKDGKVTIADLVSTAKAKCQTINLNRPFLCLDLVFISVLLRDNLGIQEDSTINLVKNLDNHEVSWALGAAVMTLQNQMS